MFTRFFAAVCSLVSVFALLPGVASAAEKQILIVLTNHSALGETGEKTGFFLSEASHPWKVFRKAGYAVTLGSPAGGFAPLDLKSNDLKDPVNVEFWQEFGSGVAEEGTLGILETLPLAKAKAEDYVAVFFAGGHGTMWDFRKSGHLRKLVADIYQQGGVIGAVCHGPAALIDVTLPDGTPLVKGKKISGFTNDEEVAVKLDKIVPYLLQSELEKSGAIFVSGENFKENAVGDARVVTGQNPASAAKTAELLVKALAEEP